MGLKIYIYIYERISVGHFCGKHAMGAKKAEMFQKKIIGLCFFVATYGTVHAFRSTVQNLPLRTRCAQGGRNTSNSEDEMCPRWASFFKFQTRGLELET